MSARLSVTVTGSDQRSCRDKAMLIAGGYFESGKPLNVASENATAVLTTTSIANGEAIVEAAHFEVDFIIEEQS